MGPRHSKDKTPTNPLEQMQMQQKRKLERQKERKKQEERLKKLHEKALKNAKKKELKESTEQQQQDESSKNEDQILDLQSIDYNQIAVTKLREQLRSDFPSFILNQLMLSVQFFGNFEIEKNTSMQNFIKMEYELNQKLENYSAILVSPIDDVVEKRVCFQAKHGPGKHISCPLQLQTLYIVYESVQVYDPNYAHIQPVCRVDVDISDFVGEDKVLKGYVRLKLRENSKNNSIIRNSAESKRRQKLESYTSTTATTTNITSSVDSVYESESNTDKFEWNRDNNSTNHYNSDTTTSAYVSSSETDYEYITNLNSHQPLTINNNNNNNDINNIIKTSILPEFCITKVQLKNDDDSSDSEFEIESNQLNVKYINSEKFFSHFKELFHNQLANNFDITENELNSATWKCSSIFTTKYEIIPAIHVPNWPGCAIEWGTRERLKYRNPINGKYIQWPTPEMIKEVLDYGCYVIPQGYHHKTEHNPYRNLEWKIIFPKAEKYLESCLTSTQIKIFMICKLLIKTFIERHKLDNNNHKNGTFMFTIEHLRAHLFWECENNFLAWNEEFLGEALMRFLKSLILCLKRKCLPDYFVRDRNLFESIPDRFKNNLLVILSEIVQNPIMYILRALRDLQQIQQFYPKFKYKELYRCIVMNNIFEFIKQIRSNLVKNNEILQTLEKSSLDIQNTNNRNHNSDESSDADDEPEGLIAICNKKEKLDESRRRRTRKLKLKEVQRIKKRLELEMKRRPSEDSIDINFLVPEKLSKIPRQMNKENDNTREIVDRMRCVLILELFISHFIQMSKSVHKLRSYNQVRIYLNQAERLVQILIEYEYSNYTDKYLNDINCIRNLIKDEETRVTEMKIAPELPLRTNLQSIDSFRKNTINIQRQNSRVKFIEPRSFLFENDTPSPSPSLKSTNSENKSNNNFKFTESTSFQIKADIHTPTTPRSTGGILKQTSENVVDFDSSSNTSNRIKLIRSQLNEDQIKIRSIILKKDNDDCFDEISESTEL